MVPCIREFIHPFRDSYTNTHIKNLLARTISAFSTQIFEMILPFCFVWIMLALKNSLAVQKPSSTSKGSRSSTNSTMYQQETPSTRGIQIPEVIPDDLRAIIPFSYYDYVTVLQARRTCRKRNDNRYEITGLYNFGRNWQVPFMKCDPRKCRYNNQDAVPFCEYSFLAVAPSTTDDIGGRTRAEQFQQYMYQIWPVLQPTSSSSSSSSSTVTDGTSSNYTLPFNFDFVQIFENERAIEEYITRDDYGMTMNTPKMSMGIVFTGNSSTDYRYTIRQNSTNLNTPASKIEGKPVSITTPPTNRLFNDYARTDVETCARHPTDAKFGWMDDSCTGLYFYNGVIATQRLVGDFILYVTGAAQTGYSVSDGGVSFVQFPQKTLVVSGFFTTVKDTAPLLILLGLLFPVASMIGYIVQEKQLRQKELMKMMSVTESDIEWSWFITFASFNIVSAMCAAVLSSVLYAHSETFLLCVFWILTLLATTTYCMAIATITSKTSRAVLIGLLVFFSGVFFTLVADYENGHPQVLGLLCLHPATAFAYGIKILGNLEDLNIGLVQDTLHYSGGRSGLSMMKLITYLSIDVVLWGVLSWYLNRIITPDFGQALPFWFPFNMKYWIPNRCKINDRDGAKLHSSASTRDYSDSSIPSEPVSETLKDQARLGKCIEIESLKKNYGDTAAVNGLTLSMYCGQITALLGHNGAGKTTTINILTGTTAPTSGHAIVAGKNVLTEISEIRQDIGVCLQHDCLFPNLTVREHVQFFARLKGLYSKVTIEEAEQQVDQTLMDVALSEKRNTLSRKLSGGMKRKLSVAIAFCGGSKVVLLDEPTSGMDPFSRRFTWNVIRKYRRERVIVLTTHNMDEAEVLGDRIAIMGEGRLRCVGSSLFLKKNFGVGYQLTIDRGQPRTHHTLDSKSEISAVLADEGHNKFETNHETTLTRMVQDSVKEAVLLSSVGSEIIYRLPMNATPSFPLLFLQLDELVSSSTINCYGVSITTLNEVFLVASRGEIPANPTSESSTDCEDLEVYDIDQESCEAMENDVEQISQYKNESEYFFFRHVVSLMKKRELNFRRDRKAWICTTIVPSVFVFVGFFIIAFLRPDLNMEPLVLNPDDYNSGIGLDLISYNNPDSPFTCQPGICSHREGYYTDKETNESYSYCGYSVKLGITPEGFTPTNQTCTVSDSSSIMSAIESDNVTI
jgi:ATP-binding cassette, subfamily A (ABC1), member 3